jgi:hypothetical protein
VTQPQTRPAPARPATASLLSLAAVLAVLISIASLVVPALRVPAHIPSVTIENNLVYLVEVTVSDGRGPTAPVGPVNRGTTARFEDVVDLGDHWVFHFAGGGVGAGTVERSREDLASSGWRIVVPDDVGRRLQQAGLSPSAG